MGKMFFAKQVLVVAAVIGRILSAKGGKKMWICRSSELQRWQGNIALLAKWKREEIYRPSELGLQISF
jgi:predicted amino acid dehydrogenase